MSGPTKKRNITKKRNVVFLKKNLRRDEVVTGVLGTIEGEAHPMTAMDDPRLGQIVIIDCDCSELLWLAAL